MVAPVAAYTYILEEIWKRIPFGSSRPPPTRRSPALAERLSTIIKADPSKLQSLLGRSSGNLIKGTTNVQAEKVATIFRSVGLDVEVVATEPAAPAPVPAPAAPEPTEAAAEPAAAPAPPTPATAVAEPPPAPNGEASESALLTSSREAAPTEPSTGFPTADAAADVWTDTGGDAWPEAEEPVGAGFESDPLGAPPPSAEPLERPSQASRARSWSAARITGLVAAVVLAGGVVLPGMGSIFTLVLPRAGDPGYGTLVVALALLGLAMALLDRVRWLWLVGLTALVTIGFVFATNLDAGSSAFGSALSALQAQLGWLVLLVGGLMLVLPTFMARRA